MSAKSAAKKGDGSATFRAETIHGLPLDTPDSHFAGVPPGTSSFKRRTIRASATSNASLPLSSPSSALSRNAKAPSCSRRTAFFCDSPVNATHRDPRRRRIVLQRLQHVRPRHLRQQHIQQDQVRLLFPRNLQRIRPIHRRADLVPRPRQRPLRCQPQKLAVIHQQNLRHSSLVLPHLVSNLGCFGSRHRGRNSVLVSTAFPIPYRQIFATNQQNEPARTNQQERTSKNEPEGTHRIRVPLNSAGSQGLLPSRKFDPPHSIRDHCRAYPPRFPSRFSENLAAPSISVFTAARQVERNSASCPSGIDFDSSSIAVPCSVAHSASANRV